MWLCHPVDFSALVEHARLLQRRLDQRAALTPWVLAEINRDRKKRPDPFRIEEFMPADGRAAPAEDRQAKADAMLAQVVMLNSMFGGLDLRKAAA